ncbi:MAG: aldo/keto reductase [Kiritimatiellae bacterium]|jgi:predicted aldo/keto reductase-like oxidoreductase|nr:aldo/keto reductase [Kiritimatiellia bacterium]MDD2347891.1 aldo/keto reductase [Kiritimatiellia bacterium]MDD3582477.1 aldo/keto reductase [Kiritimatiellia bacterium]HHU16293.1 aldo/keto reductase [Lentisphaerota bacterium]HON47336.1 aldo/keto reductase [Kiritimatiellia bacterium]
MRNNRYTRRRFLASSASMLAASALTPACATLGKRRSATDRVTLGKTGIKMSRLGIGLGSNGGNVQRNLGQEGFNRLVRDAYERGVRYLDCAQSYRTFEWLAGAIKDLPRDQLFIMSKIGGNPEKPDEVIDRHLKTFQTDYIDCVLLHCAVTPTWPQERARLMEAIDKAQAQGKIRAKGISCHSLPALRVAAASDWVEVNLVRVNPQAVNTDSEVMKWNAPGTTIEPVVEQIKIMHQNGHGVIGMKLIGEGAFTDPEDREKAIRFAMSMPEIDAATIGFKNAAEIDEAIERMNRALA